MTLAERLGARIRAHGPIGFHELVEAALYDPEAGFFTTGGGAGRRGDFITSPEVGPLFGAVVARALDDWWHGLGRPDPFTVVEAGAGRGALALAVRAAEPACAPALTYVLVERSPVLRARQAEHLPVRAADPSGSAGGEDLAPEPGSGPRFWSVDQLPDGPIVGVVLANELLDNLPFRLLERVDGSWREVRVDAVGSPCQLVEALVPARPGDAARAEALVPGAPDGARIPLQDAARAWVADALARLAQGRLVVVDYASTTAQLARRPWSEWVRTYQGQGRGTAPLDRLGAQDITCEVCLDQLDAPTTPRVRSQATVLRAHGIEALVEEGRATWHQRAGVGDLAALRARSRVREADALLDPEGLGGFSVAEWVVG